MLTSLAQAQRILLVGATSDIGTAIVTELAAAGRVREVVLAGRPSPARTDAATAAAALPGQPVVTTIDLDLTQLDTISQAIEGAFQNGDLDVAIMAAGVLPEENLLPATEVGQILAANATGPIAAVSEIATRMRVQGHGSIIVLSSVAAERPRKSNYLYGSGKAAIDAFSIGLGDDLADTGVEVIVVRPGFVHTSMTQGLDPAPLAVTAAEVAAAVLPRISRGSRVVWVPATIRPVMSGLRHLPRAVFRRLPL